MSNTQPTPNEPSIADMNVERLLSAAPLDDGPDAEFAARLEQSLIDAARERQAAQAEPVTAASSPGEGFKPWQLALAWAATVACIVAVVLFASGRQRADRGPGSLTQQNPSANQPSNFIDGNLRPLDQLLTGQLNRVNHVAQRGGMTAKTRPAGEAAQPVKVGDTIATSWAERRRVTLPDGSILYVNENTQVKLAADRRVQLDRGEIFIEVAQQTAPRGEGFVPLVVKTPQRDVTALGTMFAVATEEGRPDVLVTQGKVKASDVKQPIAAGQQLKVIDGKPHIGPAPRADHALDWARGLVAAAEGALIPANDKAGGALIAVDPDGQEAKLSLRKFHVDVHIEDGFARTTIDQTYFNHIHSRLEGTFYFPLPPDASLSRLAMYVGPNLMEGGMAERDYARQVFETIRHRQLDPALLEWVDGSTFKMRVFPLEGRQEKRIILSYTQRLDSPYGRVKYRFPGGHNLETVGQWSTNVRFKNGGHLLWDSVSHELKATRDGDDLVLKAEEKDARLSRDLVVHFRADDLVDAGGAEGGAVAGWQPALRTSSLTHEGSHYLMLQWQPELKAAPRRERRDWIFLFESSADRSPLLARVQADVIRTLLHNAEHGGSKHGDTFSLVTADAYTETLSKEPLPVTAEAVAKAMQFLDGTHLVGALDLGQAFEATHAAAAAVENPVIVHVGSGVAVLGEREIEPLTAKLPAGAQYVGVGVGKRWNRALMKRAAAATGGYFTQINPDESVSWRGFELASTLNTPRLLDISLEAAGSDAPLLSFQDSLAHGETLCALARYEKASDIPQTITVRGRIDGEEVVEEIKVGKPQRSTGPLPRMWAKLEIDRLTALGAEANKARIIELSKAMYVMSPFTSLLVLETEAMYKEHKIDRGRKDHWALYPAPRKIEVVEEKEEGKEAEEQRDKGEEEAQGDEEKADKPEKPSVDDVLKTVVIHHPTPLLYWSDRGYYGRRATNAVRAMNGYGLPVTTVLGPTTIDISGTVSVNGVTTYNFVTPDFGLMPPGTMANRPGFGWTPNVTLWSGTTPTWAFDNDHDGPMSNTWVDGLGMAGGGGVRFTNGRWFVPTSGQLMMGGGASPGGLGYVNATGGIMVPGRYMVMTDGYDQHWGASGLRRWGITALDSGLSTGYYRVPVGIPGIEEGWMEFDGRYESWEYRSEVDIQRLFVQPHWARGQVISGRRLPDDYRLMLGSYYKMLHRDFVIAGERGEAVPMLAELPYAGSLFAVDLAKSSGADDHLATALEERSNWPVELTSKEFSLLDGIDYLKDYHDVEIVVDGKLADRLAAFPKLRVRGTQASNKTLRGMLNDISGQAGLTWEAMDETIYLRRGDAVRDNLIRYVQGRVEGRFGHPNFNYPRPQTPNHDDRFTNLLAYAPAMNTSRLDIQAVLEAEADVELPRRGEVDEAARALVDKARNQPWQDVSWLNSDGEPVITVSVDGQGRFRFENSTRFGLREFVMSDGETLRHHYPELGVGSVRQVGRIHRANFAGLAPWLVLPADDLALGANLIAVDERTVAIVPLSTTALRDGRSEDSTTGLRAEDAEDSTASEGRRTAPSVHLVFAESGRLAQRRLVGGDGETLLSVRYMRTGEVVWKDKDGKELASLKLQVKPVKAPVLDLDESDLVMLPMPVRSRHHVMQATSRTDLNKVEEWAEDEALQMIAANLTNYAQDNGKIIGRRFLKQGDRRLGWFTLLMSSGYPWNPSVEVNFGGGKVDLNPVKGHTDSQLAKYIATQFRQDEVDLTKLPAELVGPQDTFVAQLYRVRQALLRRDWQSKENAKKEAFFELVTDCPAVPWKIMLLTHIDVNSMEKTERLWVADAYATAVDDPAYGLFARYEQARSLWHAGKHPQAQSLFEEWYEEATKVDALPRFDHDFINACSHQDNMNWKAMIQKHADKLIEAGRRPTALRLAWQIHQFGHGPLGMKILASAMQGVEEVDQFAMTLAAVEYLAVTGHYQRALTTLQPLLADERYNESAPLWRLGATLAQNQSMTARSLNMLEKALDLEYASLAADDTVNLEAVRRDFTQLLDRYMTLANAVATLEERPSDALLARVIGAADRWRRLDNDVTQPCNKASRILTTLGAEELAWRYVTTPIAERPNEAAPWLALAGTMRGESNNAMALRAYDEAFASEGSNAEILWNKATLLTELGRFGEARQVHQQIADGKWQPRFQGIQRQAKQALGHE